MQKYAALAAAGVLPAGTDLSGTVSTDTVKTSLTGTDTDFFTEVQRGDYIYNKGNNSEHEVRRVTAVFSRSADDTIQRIEIDQAFTTDLSGDTVQVVKPLYMNLVIENTHASGAAKVNNVTLAAGKKVIFGSGNVNHKHRIPVEPVAFDPASGTLTYTAEW